MPNKLWEEAWKQETEGLDLANARVGGRATKANPNKEDATWWNQSGPQWVDNYIAWRKGNPDWKIWIAPDGNKAIELALIPEVNGVPVKMVIDRVFEVNGELVIVDLKTSQQAPTSSLQLGFYKLGLELTFGVPVKWGTYYMARSSNVAPAVDLSEYTHERMEFLIGQFDKARKNQIFLPNTNSCQYLCGLTEHCQFSTKKDKSMATVVPNGTVHLELTTNDIFAAVQLGIITQEEARVKLGFKPTIEKEGK